MSFDGCGRRDFRFRSDPTEPNELEWLMLPVLIVVDEIGPADVGVWSEEFVVLGPFDVVTREGGDIVVGVTTFELNVLPILLELPGIDGVLLVDDELDGGFEGLVELCSIGVEESKSLTPILLESSDDPVNGVFWPELLFIVMMFKLLFTLLFG